MASFHPTDNHHVAASPRSIAGSTLSATAYTTNTMPIPARVLSPHDQKLLGGPPDLRVSVPEQWQGGAHHMQAPQQYSHPHPQQYMNYLDPQSASPAGTAQNSSYRTADTSIDNATRTLPSQGQQMPAMRKL